MRSAEKGHKGWSITVPMVPRPGAVFKGSMGGVAMMLLGVLLFAVNDALGKWLVGTYTVGQLLLVRSIAGLCAMAPFIRRAGFYAFLKISVPLTGRPSGSGASARAGRAAA
jgi:hypothetical protein